MYLRTISTLFDKIRTKFKYVILFNDELWAQLVFKIKLNEQI